MRNLPLVPVLTQQEPRFVDRQLMLLLALLLFNLWANRKPLTSPPLTVRRLPILGKPFIFPLKALGQMVLSFVVLMQGFATDPEWNRCTRQLLLDVNLLHAKQRQQQFVPPLQMVQAFLEECLHLVVTPALKQWLTTWLLPAMLLLFGQSGTFAPPLNLRTKALFDYELHATYSPFRPLHRIPVLTVPAHLVPPQILPLANYLGPGLLSMFLLTSLLTPASLYRPPMLSPVLHALLLANLEQTTALIHAQGFLTPPDIVKLTVE